MKEPRCPTCHGAITVSAEVIRFLLGGVSQTDTLYTVTCNNAGCSWELMTYYKEHLDALTEEVI